ncbi:hypothetical protein [Actinoallomurus sp. NPDC052274]|uniref:hypothetical protein n=1 Tax=Actinoallomurus sp. NPDC052274 TaxID=3155420 RepID=UPI00344AC760
MARTSDPSWPTTGPGGWEAWRGPEEPPPEPVPWYARRRLWLVVAILTAVGYVVVGVLSTARVYWEFHRKPNAWELYRAAGEEVRNRWRTWPAEKIFPDSVPYTSEQGGIEHAGRVGIAPERGCDTGIDSVSAAVLVRYGCRALLRATYVDQMQGIVLTVGIVALPDDRSARLAGESVAPTDPSVPGPFLHALAFPQTIAARFADTARQFATADRVGPYVVLTVAGPTDGRPASAVRKPHGGWFQLAPEVGRNIAGALAQPVQPDCAQKQEWKC